MSTPAIIVGGRNVRKKLIEQTLDAYFKVHPMAAKQAIEDIRQITSMETKGGDWKSGKGTCKIRFPQCLWHSLRKVFMHYLPDEPMFGDIESDIDLIVSMVPDLGKGGDARYKRGTGNIVKGT